MRYWLFKTEPNTYSWDDLKSEPDKTACWDGVRNYQARNFMRDEIKIGDRVLFYHSVVKPQSIMGIARVVREAYPDHTAWDPESPYFDPKASPDNPRWVMVDIRYERDFEPPITLDELRSTPGLETMLLLKRGMRLSIQPVTENEWKIILALRGMNPDEFKG
ncbi:MAG: EVE domain-containing protein [candidate division KSB1 bacterium]|nr:EVE domain-containing protein [candidate division KSB1 bacterium]